VALIATFALPPPDKQGVVYGEMHLQWSIPFNPRYPIELANYFRHEGLSEAQVNAALKAQSSADLIQLQQQDKQRSLESAPNAEDLIFEQFEKQPRTYKTEMQRRFRALKRTQRPAAGDAPKIRNATVGQPDFRIFSVDLPANPALEAYREKLLSIIPTTDATESHPELNDKISRR
jgi:hypothetical protein